MDGVASSKSFCQLPAPKTLESPAFFIPGNTTLAFSSAVASIAQLETTSALKESTSLPPTRWPGQ
eukprot:5684962-Prymnesium_polylepis.1